MAVQTSPQGHFAPIGNQGFYVRGNAPARFDQQPIEAHASVSACLAAYRATREDRWRRHARRAFEWFLGHNDLGFSLYDPATGGCCDGLSSEEVSVNQGAESTLAFLLALTELRLLEQTLPAANGFVIAAKRSRKAALLRERERREKLLEAVEP